MKHELYNEIRAALERYYDKKLKNSGYYNDQDIWDKLEADYMPTRYEMMCSYDAARENALAREG